ncbi:hypothetical protein PBY51_011001 [Eleginops maclovinus]|uniref:Uncharacterized protein n=1 Tax=Eleginops maclovinus TaxID=56733 RepID=A0AAN7XBU1_ELEMC|nr:hypothetical protein PBY51_011001 [Eleginops maclovinus]
MVVLSCADECEITSAPLLCSVSDCLSDTCSDSAPLPAYQTSHCWVLVPPLSPLPFAIPAHQSAAYGRLACSEADIPKRHTPNTANPTYMSPFFSPYHLIFSCPLSKTHRTRVS